MTQAAYETSAYTVIRKTDALEMRVYPDAHWVSTSSVTDDGEMGDNFNQLFRYIGGYNRTKALISMTTPVYIQEQGSHQKMSFVLPFEVGESGPPTPLVNSVFLENVRGGTFAVLRYSGRTNLIARTTAAAQLKAALACAGVDADSEPLYAFYDPPWTPAAVRRNEVMVRIAAG